MIDTIKIITKDFEYNHHINAISDYPMYEIYQPIKNGDNQNQPLILTDCTGKSFYGQYLALYKTPLRGTGILQINNKTADGPALSLQFSLPKFLTGQNLHLATKGDILLGKKEIEKELAGLGIFLNIDTCTLSRVDLTVNAMTEYSFRDYIPLLQKLNCKRDTKRLINAETFSIGNTNRLVCNYDKVQEMLANGDDINITGNIFRNEVRLLNQRTMQSCIEHINKGLELKTYTDLYKQYDYLYDVRNVVLKQKMFAWDKFPDKEIGLDLDNIFINCMHETKDSKLPEEFLSTCIARSAVDVLQAINVEHLVTLYESGLQEQCLTKDTLRQRKSRLRNRLSALIGTWIARCAYYQEVPYSKMYNELQKKLLKVS